MGATGVKVPVFGADDEATWQQAVASQARAKQANDRLRQLLAVPPPDNEPQEDSE